LEKIDALKIWDCFKTKSIKQLLQY